MKRVSLKEEVGLESVSEKSVYIWEQFPHEAYSFDDDNEVEEEGRRKTYTCSA